MIIDLDQAVGPTLEADICIVGAGAAGITIAQQLAGSGLKVLLAESGGMAYEQETQDLYKADNVSFKPFPVESTRLRYLGGTTNHWGGMCRSLDPVDLEGRFGEGSRWPLAHEELSRFYPGAQAVCDLGGKGFDEYLALSKQYLGLLPQTEGSGLKTALFLRSPPTRFGEKYSPALRAAQNINLLLHANLTRFEEAPGGGTVAHAHFRSLKGAQCRVTARQFVLAAGGLENARLLLCSKDQNGVALGNRHDLVGRYYMDHLGVYLGKVLFAADVDLESMYFKEHKVADATMGAFWVPTERFLRQQRVGNFRLLLQPATEADFSIEVLKSLKNEMASLKWPAEFLSKLSSLASNAGAIGNIAYKNIFDTTDQPFSVNYTPSLRLCHASVNLEQAPNRESRVYLGREQDALGMPKLVFDWKLGPTDTKTVKASIQALAAALGSANRGRFLASAEVSTGELNYSISCHHSGTTRMADDPRQGVVDRDCRVHGTRNLYVVGSSVFPSIGWANPTLTIVALALRLADHLRSAFPKATQKA